MGSTEASYEMINMTITSVEIKNIKKYDHEIFNFTDGIQLILGPNGSGKSTIIESIGWVLFDCLDYKLSEWVKWGKNSGSVTITILDDNNDVYTVYRETSKDSGGKYYMKLSGKEIANGVHDVQVYIKKIFRINDETHKIFRDIIGVSQELMSAQFSLSGSQKKKMFDPLLGVEKYNKLWNILKPVESSLKDNIDIQNIEKSRIEGWLESETEILEEHEQNTENKRKIKLEFDDINDKFTKTKKVVSILEEKKKKSMLIDKYKKDMDILHTRLESITKTKNTLEDQKKKMLSIKNEALQQKTIREKIRSMDAYERTITDLKKQHKILMETYMHLKESIEYAEQQEEDNYEKLRLESETSKKLEVEFKSMEEQKIRIESEIKEIDRQCESAKIGKCPITDEECPVDIFSTVNTKKKKAYEYMENIFLPKYLSLRLDLNNYKNSQISFQNLVNMIEEARLNQKKLSSVVKEMEGVTEEINKNSDFLIKRKDLMDIDRSMGNVLDDYDTLVILINNTKIDDEELIIKEIDDNKTKISDLEKDIIDFSMDKYDLVKSNYASEMTMIESKQVELQKTEEIMLKSMDKVNLLKRKKSEIKDVLGKIKVLEKKHELIQMTRDKLRLIPSEITKNLIVAINSTANRYYNEISGASSLEINENYDVRLTDYKGIRSYKGMSGGEKMTASVAIRLALLSEITNIRFLFLDEPTSSVDSERKQLLSDIISKVKGLDQLFVISHDDIFISQSDNIVEVKP